MNLWTETDILFAMFILKANNCDWDWLTHVLESDWQWTKHVELFYADLFEDRGIVEESVCYICDQVTKRLETNVDEIFQTVMKATVKPCAC